MLDSIHKAEMHVHSNYAAISRSINLGVLLLFITL